MAFIDDGCSPCRDLKYILKELKGFGMPVYEIIISENLDLVEKYSIDEIPTVIIFRNGRIADLIGGLSPKEEYLKYLCYFTS